jgi:hypothetical protein
MKKIFTLTGLTFLMAILLNCQNSNDPMANNNEEARILSDKQIQMIGAKHNEYLKEAFANTNWKAVDKSKELRLNFNAVASSKNLQVSLNQEPKDTSTNFDIVKSKLNDQNSVYYFQKVSSFLRNDIQNKNIEEIKTYLDNIEKDFKKKYFFS